MEPDEILLGDGGPGGGNNNLKAGDGGFIDRSKVRILLCDNDSKSSEEVFTLLCKCSYQVTSVRSPRQVIDALNAEGRDIDIILSEVDLPMAKGLKLLKYIMRDKQLQRIPVIMMSAQDEVSLVVKCLRLGAADYLVKPLRTNELLNLWTHMWRRRRMLGLAEKNIISCEFDMVPSDHSDANTNSTTLFSDDTDEKSRKNAIQEMSVSIRQEDESNMIIAPGSVDTQLVSLSNDQPNMPGSHDQHRGKNMSGPKKSELKIGHSSAFFTYVKSTKFRSSTGAAASVDENTPQLSTILNKLSSHGEVAINLNNENPSQHSQTEKEVGPWGVHGICDTRGHDPIRAQENPSHTDEPSSNSFPDSMSLDQSCTPPLLAECSQQMNLNVEEYPKGHMQEPRTNSHHDVSGYNAHSGYPYYLSGMMSQVMMSQASSMYQESMNNLQGHPSSAMLPHQYNHMPHCPPHHIPGMASFPYYPVNLCLQPGQMPPTVHQWPPYGSSSSNDGKVHKVDRREAALLKFRQKRKERCFDKKIRYVNRKKLAERRPRVRGQFVRKINGINVDLNGQPTSADFDDDEDDEEEEEEQAGRDSSPENDSSVLHG